VTVPAGFPQPAFRVEGTMSAIYPRDYPYVKVEQEGLWLLVIDKPDGLIYVGPFTSAFTAACYAQDRVESSWDIIEIIRPEQFFTAGTEPPEPREVQGELL
jgi:hypothetical protein